MQQKALVTICGAAIAASLFLSWFQVPATINVTPWTYIKEIDPARWQELPPLVLAYIATFGLGALAAILAVIGWAPRFLALVTALLPIGLAVYIWLRFDDVMSTLPPPLDAAADFVRLTMPDLDIGKIVDFVQQVAGIGFYLWAGGAVLLLLVALLDRGDSY